MGVELVQGGAYTGCLEVSTVGHCPPHSSTDLLMSPGTDSTGRGTDTGSTEQGFSELKDNTRFHLCFVPNAAVTSGYDIVPVTIVPGTQSWCHRQGRTSGIHCSDRLPAECP